MDDLFFVETLEGMDAVILIPLLFAVLYGYEVPESLSSMTGATLQPIQPIPSRIAPLTWTFGHIISAFNTFPALESLYSFRESIQPFSLGHARRVLLSSLFLLREKPVGLERWTNAYAAVLMEDDVDFIDCEGRGVGNELFVKVLADDRSFTMRECLSADVVTLVKTYFSEEDCELVVDESLLPLWLAIGVDQRQPPSLDLESALVNILQDERQTIDARSLRRYVGGSDRTSEGLMGEVWFAHETDTYGG